MMWSTYEIIHNKSKEPIFALGVYFFYDENLAPQKNTVLKSYVR